MFLNHFIAKINARKCLSFMLASQLRPSIPRACVPLSFYSTKSEGKSSSSTSVTESTSTHHQQVSTHVSVGQKAKQAVVDVTYLGMVGFGVILVGGIFYLLFKELWSRETPTGIYNESSKICLDNFTLQEALGTPIKVSAESGGRRVFQIRHKIFAEKGSLYMIINYYLTGSRNTATMHVKCKQNPTTKKFEYEYIVAELDYPFRGESKIIVQRADD